ncbi:MAG TPA: SCO2523 family variant P-loop protein [Amycolatopsis sp.]|jgi:hypothetical protein|nr:SCO2523 family variant P-loop protein [Amycolatopsis sp.]
MLVFAVSDKGGTGRSVTGCNLAYHLAQQHDVAYLDFDFGSPTAGAIFEIPKLDRGVVGDEGLHSYIEGRATTPYSADIWRMSDRRDLRARQSNAGRLVLFPGDRGGAEFSSQPDRVKRCADLFSKLDREFEICLVDLSAGRSHAVQMALKATALPALRSSTARWLVFHRWTRQHIVAAAGLVHGERGLLAVGADAGHARDALFNSIRFVRTAVPDLDVDPSTTTTAQASWLSTCNGELKKLAERHKAGNSALLGETPMESVLQWREQVISDVDVSKEIANGRTIEAFRDLAKRLMNPVVWEGL